MLLVLEAGFGSSLSSFSPSAESVSVYFHVVDFTHVK